MSDKIRIISTSDVHGKVFPHEYSYEKAYALEFEYGFAKLAMLVKSLRNDKSISDSILIDNGDTLEGSPLQSFYYRNLGNCVSDAKAGGAYRYQASPVSYAMSLMGYDYINIGNHDFEKGWLRKNLHPFFCCRQVCSSGDTAAERQRSTKD